MKVLVIPEDPTRDQFILRPVVERIFRDLGRPARIEVLRDPHLRGVSEALSREMISEIVADNPMVDLFLLLVDRDCDRFGNTAKATQREAEHNRLLATLAIEEVEVWMLAIQDDLPARFSAIRREGEECDPKEQFADPFLRQRGWHTQVGGGYKRAMHELSESWKTLRARCPEIADLQDRLRKWLDLEIR